MTGMALEVFDDRKPSRLGVWIAAIRPRTLPAAATPVVVGVALALAWEVFAWLPAVVALFGALCIQVGTNLANDYSDFFKGADTADRVGPARATQRGWVTPRQVLIGAVVGFGLAFLSGLYLVWVAGWPLLVVGIASIVSGILYTGGPKPLGYMGLGDAFAFLFFGPVAVVGTVYVQMAAHGVVVFPWPAVWASLPIGAMIAAILVVNNHRDRITDATAGKRTLAVRIGPRWTRYEYAFLMLASPLVAAGFIVSSFPARGLWGLLLLPSLVQNAFLLTRFWPGEGKALNPLLGRTAQAGLLLSLVFAVALVGASGVWG